MLTDSIAHLEWEGLQAPRTYEGEFDKPQIISGRSRANLTRDESYNVGGTAYGFSTSGKSTEEETQFMLRTQDTTFRASSQRIDFYACRVTRMTWTPPSSLGVGRGSEVTAPFVVREVHVRNSSGKTALSFREWFLNAPLHNMCFHEGVERSKTTVYEHRNRGALDLRDRFELVDYKQGTAEGLLVDFGAYRFLFECVPDAYAPAWSRKLMVEYREAWGGVPDVATRKDIAAMASYILGRELILIGDTLLTQEGYVAEARYLSHGRPNIQHLCQDYPRLPLGVEVTPSKFKQALATAVTAYQQKKQILPLEDCLGRYWLAIQTPPGLGIVILATALELLAQAWFRSKESKSRGEFLEHKAYRALLSPEIESLSAKLEKTDQGKAILKRILSANRLGTNDQMTTFFAELGIELSVDDRQVLQRRNKYVHGSPVNGSEASQSWGRYASLFTRAMVCILNLQ